MALAQTLDEFNARFKGKRTEVIEAIRESLGALAARLTERELFLVARVKYYGASELKAHHEHVDADYQRFCETGEVPLYLARPLLP